MPNNGRKAEKMKASNVTHFNKSQDMGRNSRGVKTTIGLPKAAGEKEGEKHPKKDHVMQLTRPGQWEKRRTA